MQRVGVDCGSVSVRRVCVCVCDMSVCTCMSMTDDWWTCDWWLV